MVPTISNVLIRIAVGSFIGASRLFLSPFALIDTRMFAKATERHCSGVSQPSSAACPAHKR